MPGGSTPLQAQMADGDSVIWNGSCTGHPPALHHGVRCERLLHRLRVTVPKEMA